MSTKTMMAKTAMEPSTRYTKTAPVGDHPKMSTSVSESSPSPKKTPSMEKKKMAKLETSKRMPINRNAYESIGPGAELKKIPVNRNLYEAMGGVGATGAPVNRPIYETVAAPGGGTEKAKPAIPAIGADPDLKSGSDPDEDSTRARHRMRLLEEEKENQEFARKKKKIIIGGIIVLVVLVIGASIGAVIYVFQDKPPEKKAEEKKIITRETGHYGYDYCVDYFNKTRREFSEECVTVFAINKRKCTIVPQCQYQSFAAKLITSDIWYFFKDWSISYHGPVDKSDLICYNNKTDPPSNLCINHTGSAEWDCSGKYVGKTELYDLKIHKPQWVDNCDTPNSCWESGTRFPSISVDVADRSRCLNDSFPCPKDNLTAAIIWMQHVHCEFNADHVMEEFCEPYPHPFRLWECRPCENNPKTYTLINELDVKEHCTNLGHEFGNWSRGGCVVVCINENGNNTTVSLPHGTSCITGISTGYCFYGECYVLDYSRTYVKDRSHLKSVTSKEQCLKDKETRKKARGQRRFVIKT